MQVDGPITGRSYVRAGLRGGRLQPEYFFCVQVDGPITGVGWEAYNRDFTVSAGTKI